MDAHWEDEDWASVLAGYAERDRAAEPVRPTIYVGPNTYEAALEIGYRPEDLTLVTPDGRYEDSLAAYIAAEMPKAYYRFYDQHLDELNQGDLPGEPLGILAAIRQEMELTRDGAGGSFVQIGGRLGTPIYNGSPYWAPQQQNDMRPREVDRAKVKAGRKAARVNRRKRGRK
jgi:hypothetical protein